ncbi:RagB/SusD family nutrient uptake outer membrane protein [Flagellimonas pacifica]|uniref:Starch-binding associating with outer membrane n=1 Tax=Flagellimonas pacifica TaxID=1247520 RepID=A0A285N0E5_9FLAO|nr:RagB/SusD family nutrient uptake outer membrane protein [Allomuricauda parva]SNZ01496.1 Starch-binding associating with outer membrane [Allomuricauda parva]
MKRLILNKVLLLGLLIFSFSCTKEIDNVINQNNPDRSQVLANGTDLIGIVSGGFVTWWQANNRDLYPAVAVAGDIATCSWGNFGMRVLSNEPRNPILNAASWADSAVLEQPWQGNYAAVSSANDVINAITNNGITWIAGGVDNTPMVLASAYLLRGFSYGYLGLLFEKGFLVDENTDISQKLPFVTYSELITQAISDLDAAIAIANANSFEIPNTVINGVSLPQDELIKLCNSYKARFIVQSARNQGETNAIDWNTIKTYAENGITEDFGPTGDNGISWWNNANVLMDSPNGFGAFGGRLDMRIVNLLDPSQPAFFPATSGSTLDNPEMTTPDARVGTGKDFEFRSDILFRAERGRFHYSHYFHTRNLYDEGFSDGADAKQIKTFMLEDNRLLLAEAKARLNDATAVDDVNAGSRVTRGELTPLAGGASQQEILDAIFYERYIELYNTAVGSGFFDRRRINELQVGTFRHFPVPATELEVLEEELYTLGGVSADPTGVVPHYNIAAAPARTDDTNIPTFN